MFVLNDGGGAARARTRLSWLSLLCAMALSSATGSGCGSDSSGQPASHVDEAKPLGMLSPSEQMACGQDLQSLVAFESAQNKANICRYTADLTAVVQAQFQMQSVDQMRQACAMTEQQCLSGTAAPSTQGMQQPATCAGFPTTCMVTVGQLRQCVQDSQQGLNTLIASAPTCATLDPNIFSQVDVSKLRGGLCSCNALLTCNPLGPIAAPTSSGGAAGTPSSCP